MPLAESRLEVLQVRKLCQCVRREDRAQIAKLVELGIPGLVNYQDPSTGESALHIAASENLDGTVSQLLELGAGLSVQDLEGRTPVMTACHYGHLQALEQLAVGGINPAITDKFGRPSLFHCLHPTNRHAKCLGFLLECGADPNTKNTAGLPILCATCREGLDKLLERLLDKGADPNARELAEGKPAVVMAAEGDHVECLKLLLVAGVEANAVYGTKGLCALHIAAALSNFAAIQVLSAYGADFSLAALSGENALHFATMSVATRKMICIRLLGQRGCPANEANEEGNTPQKLAKAEGFKDAMKELKKLSTMQDKASHGARPKGFAEPWAVRLYDWVVVNRHAVFDLLREQDAAGKGTIATEAFTTTLQSVSAPLESEEWAKLLVVYDKKGEGSMSYDDFLAEQKYIHAQYKIGPDDSLKAKKGKKGKKKGGKGKKGGKTKILFPIYYEQERPPTAGVPEGIIEREQFLTDVQRFPNDATLSHGYVDDSQWYLIQPERQFMQVYEAIRHGDFVSLTTALACGMPVDFRDKYNKTPLMVACAHGRTDMVRFLLERGADADAYDNFLWTSLHHAAHAGQELVVRILLDAGADIDAQSVNGGTALMRAIETSQKTIVKLLIERGAKVTLENKNGATALDVAKNWGDDFIYAIVYAKHGSLPPAIDKKGDGAKDKAKGKGKGKAGGKGGKGKKKKGGGEDALPKILPGPPLEPLPPPPRLPTSAEIMEQARRHVTLGSLQADTVVKPSPAYKPRPAWVSRPPSTSAQLDLKSQERDSVGVESADFDESRSPFQLQILARVQALEVTDA